MIVDGAVDRAPKATLDFARHSEIPFGICLAHESVMALKQVMTKLAWRFRRLAPRKKTAKSVHVLKTSFSRTLACSLAPGFLVLGHD